jgi:hypothetical protein
MVMKHLHIAIGCNDFIWGELQTSFANVDMDSLCHNGGSKCQNIEEGELHFFQLCLVSTAGCEQFTKLQDC